MLDTGQEYNNLITAYRWLAWLCTTTARSALGGNGLICHRKQSRLVSTPCRLTRARRILDIPYESGFLCKLHGNSGWPLYGMFITVYSPRRP